MIEIRWIVSGNQLVRRVNVIGKVISKGNEDNWSLYVLPDALKIIDIAKRYRGRLTNYEKPPIIKEKEAIYFEIIFENIIDYESFTEIIPKEL